MDYDLDLQDYGMDMQDYGGDMQDYPDDMQDYGQMYGGEEYGGVMVADDGIYDNDDIPDYDDEPGQEGEADLDLAGSEQAEESVIEEPYYLDDDDIEQPKISQQEQVKMIHLRSLLTQLTEKVTHHQYLTEKTREEQKQCRSRIETLEIERDKVYAEIQNADTTGNTSALYRLRAQHERLCKELENEQNLIKMISERLEKEEYELAKVEVERGKFLLAEDELIKKEEQLNKEKTDQALRRLKKEEMKARQAEKNRRIRGREFTEALKERERQYNRRVESAEQSHQRHNKFLNNTLQKLKQREEEETTRYKQDMKKKMDMLLKLKGDISANRENLRALHARDKAREKEDKQKEEEERQNILSQGGNPEETMLIKKRLEEFERQKLEFLSEQKVKQASIMEKVLLEEDRLKKRKKQQPQLWEDPKREKSLIVKPMKQKPLKIFREMTDSSLFDDEDDSNSKKVTVEKSVPQIRRDDDSDNEDRPASREASHIPDSSDSSDAESDDERKVDLAKPEFEGLWDQHKPYKVPRDMDSTMKLPGASKMEREIIQTKLIRQREGIVTKQVAAGREFSGCPFYSKPDVIHFKDFTVGKTYKKKVTLTNVSYTVNYCKFLDITEHLKDFIEIHFDPPGQMSAGLTCEMLVTFKPMINEDLEGVVKFLSQTGPFAIPLICTTKKCDLTTDTVQIDFGTTVIGETLKRTFTLSNKGALGTKYEFFKATGSKQRTVTSAGTSLGRLTTADTVRAVSPGSTDLIEKSKKDLAASTDKTGDVAKKPSDESAGQAEKAPSQDEGGTVDGQEGSQAPAEGQGETTGEAEQPTIPEEEAIAESPDLAVSEMDEYGVLDGMKVGLIASGELEPFSSVKLEIIWQPTIPGKVDSEFLITFSDPLSESISIQTLGNAIDVPVWVERQTVDLKICMYDRLYQDTIIVNNRATTALRLKFEVCKELRNHLELLPKTGYIQAQSQFSAQLKFLPRQSLFEEAGKFFDKETGVLEAPMIITVADQTRPVPFTVQAVVTTSDMEFDVTNLDFGYCTIYESVKTTIKLSNRSILPQEYGFVGLPDYVEVQPNDGFGTLLPLETIDLEVVFSPKKAKDYKFELLCKSLINREFKIQCKGIGVHPPLELSKQVVHFSATALYDVSTTAIHVVNSHTSTNEFTHPVPRIGKGEIAPVTPTSFEFIVPENAPLTLSPSVGTIEPGKKCKVEIRFTPKLSEKEIKREGVRMATKMLEKQAEKDYQEQLKREKEAQEQAQQKPGGKGAKSSGKDKPGSKTPAKGKASPAGGGGGNPATLMTVSGPKPVTPPDPENITKDSAAYTQAIGSLLRQCKGSFRTYMIPCYVASGTCGNPGELPYSIYNTLYLEVHCPIVKPELVVISDNGNAKLDFGDISLGQNIIKSITIQNISKKTVELSSSILDTGGPFVMLNALRILPPDGTHTMMISFTPNAGRVFHEVLAIKTWTSALHITLAGKGVSPLVNLSPALDDGKFDMGAVLATEYLERTFKMQNVSTLSIDYSVRLESLSLLRHLHAQQIPEFVARDKKSKSLVGTQNNNGQNVFDLVPADGTIPPGGSTEITVTFAPDHPSDYYSDGIKIELFGKEESHSFQIKGMAKPRIMYIDGFDERSPDVESLAEKPSLHTEDEDAKALPEPVLFTLQSIAKESEFIPASRELHVGCVRTMAVSQKKNGEFQFENVPSITGKGFNVEPQKGMVEAGAIKPVTITWSPPPGHDPNQPVDASILLTLKGDTVDQFKIMLRAIVVSD